MESDAIVLIALAGSSLFVPITGLHNSFVCEEDDVVSILSIQFMDVVIVQLPVNVKECGAESFVARSSKLKSFSLSVSRSNTSFPSSDKGDLICVFIFSDH